MILMALMLFAAPVSAADKDAAMQRKISLAERYADLTHREQRTEAIAVRQMKLAWRAIARCIDEPCERVLDEDIAKAVHDASLVHEKAVVQLLATRLSEGELQAALDFASSPQGQAILTVENDMNDDLARIGHQFSQNINDEVHQSFCAQEPAACPRLSGRRSDRAASHP
ncbi:MAG: DUF2059 domain-containing protein [Sphingomonadaceae bacterium]|nr:DUF2059 domain-containing protein [Sphingomonadaceae bacterium]